MRIHFPNSARLQNIQGFLKQINFSDPSRLEVTFHPKWVAAHPMVLAMTACAARLVLGGGGEIICEQPMFRSLPYLIRLGLFEQLGVNPGAKIRSREESGRFIPLTRINSKAEISSFVTDMVPLLHTTPTQAAPIRHVISELLRNALEHSGSPVGALVCAQYYPLLDRVAIGVADAGLGIPTTIKRSHAASTDLEAVALSLRPGVSGTTPRIGGNDYNAGLGLYFTRCIARAARCCFVVHSGSAVYKLQEKQENQQSLFRGDPLMDRHFVSNTFPSWGGTAVGVDIQVKSGGEFSAVLEDIHDAYRNENRMANKLKYRKPMFVS